MTAGGNVRTQEDGPLSTREKEVWHALKKMGDIGLALVASDIEAATGLSGADFGILSRLQDLGRGKLSQRELATSLGWHKSRLSHQLTRMEARGLLRRAADGSGRGVILAISPAGRKALSMARPVHASAVRKYLLRHISEQERELLLRIAQSIGVRH